MRRLADHGQGPARDEAGAGLDVLGRERVLPAQRGERVEHRVQEVAAWIGLEAGVPMMPAGSKVRADRLGVKAGVEMGGEQAVSAFEDRARSGHAGPRQPCRMKAAVRAPAGVHRLYGRALADELEQAGRHAAGEPERVDELALVELEQQARGDRGAERRGDARGVEPLGMKAAARGQSHPHRALEAEDDGPEQLRAGGAGPFGGGQARGNHRRARMQDRARMGVVIVLGMREEAVDEGRGRGFETVRKGEDRGRSRLAVAGQRPHQAPGFRRARSGQADPGDVEQAVPGIG